MEDVGEKKFISDLLPNLGVHQNFLNGFGDDASAVRLPDGTVLVFKIDRAAGPTAANRGWTDYRMWGRLAVTSNCSDILAGGGLPAAMMIALILPRSWSAAQAEEVIYGCAEECSSHDVAFVGGDTKEGSSPELVGSAVGVAPSGSFLTRKHAKPGDLIVLAGSLGGFLGSYLQILANLNDSGIPVHKRADDWLDYISHPRARWTEGRAIIGSGVATSAMDTSDGLYDAISTLTRDLGAEILLDELPYHSNAFECREALGTQLLNLGLGVGDWNIVYTVDAAKWERWWPTQDQTELNFTVIGQVKDSGGLEWIDRGGRKYRCTPIVNQHFKARFEDESTLIERLRMEDMLMPIEAGK